jgi:hypothetical protein
VSARYNNNNMSLDRRLLISQFSTLAKPGPAKLSGDRVCGSLVDGYVIVSDPALMAERFANWSATPNGILKFTQKYGPLWSVPLSKKREYCVDLEGWLQRQRMFRDTWRITSTSSVASDVDLGRGLKLAEHSFLIFYRLGAELRVKDMMTLIDVCLACVPVNRLRICKAPDCSKPYFIAHRLNSTLCNSLACKRWNQLRLKREWFDREKPSILEDRKRRRKEERNVTHKAR